MKLDANARYSESHEWVRKEGDLFVYGITDHAQDQLSDLVYLEPPQVATALIKAIRSAWLNRSRRLLTCTCP